MALPTISPSQFTGKLKIVANQFKQEDLQYYIDTFVPQYTREVLGDAAFIDINDQTRQKWTDLLNGVNYTDANGERKVLNGFTELLKHFIYFEFIRDDWFSTQAGKVKSSFENSTRSSSIEVGNIAASRYNYAAEVICNQYENFFEANESFSEEITSSIDNADNTYTLSISNTKYLESGETVTIEAQDYVVISSIDDVSITIQAFSTGLDFTGDFVDWSPYEDVELNILKPVII